MAFLDPTFVKYSVTAWAWRGTTGTAVTAWAWRGWGTTGTAKEKLKKLVKNHKIGSLSLLGRVAEQRLFWSALAPGF